MQTNLNPKQQDSLAYIIILTDGRPGHMTQAEGVARLLQQQSNYHIKYLNIYALKKWQKLIARFILNYADLSQHAFKFLAPLTDTILWSQVAYIVSAGGDTLVANVLLKRYVLLHNPQVKNIILSSLHGIAAQNFDIIFTIDQQKQALQPYCYYPISPNKMTARSENIAQLKQQWQVKQVITVCIGADVAQLSIGSVQDWREYISVLKQQFPQHQLLITTSRRTPAAFEKALQQALVCVLATSDQLFLYQQQQANVVEMILMADFVVLSQDSGSMISEAVMAAKPVLIVQPEHSNQHAFMQSFLFGLQQKKLLQLWQGAQQDLPRLLATVCVQQHSSALLQAIDQSLNRHPKALVKQLI